MAIHLPGLAAVLVFYAAVMAVGIWSAYRIKGNHEGSQFSESSMVAGRNLGLVVGIFTMSATSVGGGFLSSTAESVATYGLVWTVFPLTLLIGFILGSLIFARPMRERNYITMLDPLQQKYGDLMTGLLLIAALLAEILWGATILMSLGTNLSVIIRLDINVAIIGSSIVAVLYTLFGQMVSVAYTDVLQFILVVVGMVLCIPFIYTDENMGDIGDTSEVWLGTIEGKMAPMWCDFFIAQALGAIPWNTYLMRLLSAKTVRHAQIISVAGGVISLAMAVPPFLIGAASTAADWNATDYGTDPVPDDVSRLLPLVIDSFTPKVISIIALSAVAAAVMSSMDSIILSSSSMFTRNIYQMAFRPTASDKEMRVVHSFAMIAVTVSCLLLAIFVDTIYGIFILSADLMYVTVFPQLLCAVFLSFVNPYGSLVGYVASVILRFGGGESTLGIDPFIKYPNYDDVYGQLFPFRTLAMVTSVVCVVVVSYAVNYLFRNGIIPASWDVTGMVVHHEKKESVDHAGSLRGDSKQKQQLKGTDNDAYEEQHF